MSTEEDWDEIERSNGSVLCKRFLKHGKCSSKPCQWEHISDPGQDKPRPFCHNNLYLKGGCPDGQYCSLSHDRPDRMGITQTTTDSLPFEPAKETQSNDRQNPDLRSNVSQLPRGGVFPRVSNGNNFRASTQTNHNPSYNGVSRPRQDWIQQKGAVVGSVGEKFRLVDPGVGGARSMPNMRNGPKDGGVFLGNSFSNGRSGSPQFGHPKNTHGTQHGKPVNIAPINGRINSAPHNFVPLNREYSDSRDHQSRPSNGQRNHPPRNSNQSSRDEVAVNNRLNYDSNSGYRNKPNGAPQNRGANANYAQFPFESKGPFNGQARVMPHDPKYPTFPSRQQEARSNTTHTNGIRESPKNSYHPNGPQTHNGGNYRIQGNFNGASSAPPGDPGGSDNGQNSRLSIEKTSIGSITILESAEPKLKGGGVALNNLPQVDNATKNKNEPGASDPPVTVVTGIVEKDTNSNGINPVKTPGHSNLISPMPSTIMPRNGISGGEVISSLFENAFRMNGRMSARSGIKSPENPRPRSPEENGKLMEGNHTINSNLEVIPAESAGNQLAINQQMDPATLVEVVPEGVKNSGLGETEDIEGGAKIGDTEHGEHEEGGAKLPVEQSIQPEPPHSQNKIGLAGGNQSVSNGVTNPLQGTRPPIGPKNWKPSTRDLPRQNRYSSNNRVLEGHGQPNYVAQSREGDNFSRAPGWGVQSTNNSKSESMQQLGPRVGEAQSPNELIPQLYKSVYQPRMIQTAKDVTLTSPQPTIYTSSSTNSLPKTTREQPRESQFPQDVAFANQGKDSILLQSDRHLEISRTPIFHPKNNIYMPFRDQLPPTLFSYSEPSVQSQANKYDIEPNVYNLEPETEPNRAYTPEPELEPDSTSSTSESESDLNTSRDYHEKMRIEAKASGINRGVWGDKTPPNRPGSVEFEDFKEAPPVKDDTREKNLALAARLQKPGQFSKPPQAEQPLEKKTQPITKEPPKKKAHPTVAQPPKEEARPVSKDPPKKMVPPIAIKSLKEEARPRSADPPKKTVLPIALQPPKEEARPISEDRPKKIIPPTVKRPIKEETRLAAKELPRNVTSLVADKTFEKIPSAWGTPLIKTALPKASQEICWLCKSHHQRDRDCKADPKAIEAGKSGGRWASTIDRSDDWGYRGDENINGWSDDDSGVAIPESKKSSPVKPKRASKGPRPVKGSQNQDKNVVKEEVAEPTKATSKGRRRKKERTPKEPRTNGKAEKKQPASEDSPGASITDGPKSVMFRTNRNHFGKYYDTEISGIRKLSEDTLHMIFSYVADGLMPEDQMKMKNVHIGSNFRLDSNFTTTRYRRLKSVILSCRYWRNLCQHIVYKYVNLDQFGNFKRFVHTISEDPELGKMVHAIKINIQGGASYTTHDNRPSRQELSEMPKSSDSAQLFTSMMENCPELQILSVNMYGAIRGFNFVFTKFPKMREMQIMDDSSKGMVVDNLWKSLDNYPNLEKFKIFHSEENGSMNFDSLKIPPKNILSKGSTVMVLKALTMERAPELSDKILGVFASRLKQLTHLVIVDCKLVTSAGLARAIQRMPNASQLNRLIYYVWVDPFGKATQQEMAPQRDHLCSAIREHCTGLTYLNWKPYRICGDFWKGSNFRLLKRCRIEPMVFKDCNKEVELRNHSKFMDAYRQAREEERLPELAEDRAVFDFYF